MVKQDRKPQLRTTPNTAFSTANPSPTAPELQAADRRTGWLNVNRWTYRLIRVVGRFRNARPQITGIRFEDDSSGALVVRPDHPSRNGAILYIHGGGYVIGDKSHIAAQAAELARDTGVPVICPPYRLAPEHPFPAGLDDCHGAWLRLVKQAEHPDRIILAGVSAGGGLAAALAQRLRDEGGQQPLGQLLIYPMLDDRTAMQRELDRPRHRGWGNHSNLFGWQSYLGHTLGQEPAPYAVPARRADLSGLPATWIGVGTSDLFLDENRTYAARLRQAGVPVDYVELDGAIHGFNSADTPFGQTFRAAQSAFVARLLDSTP